MMYGLEVFTVAQKPFFVSSRVTRNCSAHMRFSYILSHFLSRWHGEANEQISGLCNRVLILERAVLSPLPFFFFFW